MGSTTGKIRFEGASQYRSELAKLSSANKALAAEMKELKSSFNETTTAEQKHEQLTAQLNKQIAAQGEYVQKLRDKLADMAKQQMAGTTEYNKTEEAMHKAQATMNEMEQELANLSKAEEAAKPSAMELRAAMETISEVTEKAMGALKECAQAAMDYEQAMASVSRTTGATGEDLSGMAEAFQEMSLQMPVAAEEFASIATTAGQLGIAKEDILTFTETIAQLAVVADMSSTEVATALAQIANITGDGDFQRMGDTIAVMGDATATTSARILDMSLNLAAAASNAGMTSDEIIAISAAVSSTGVQARAGGTAISRMIQQMNMAVAEGGESLKQFAEVCGYSSAEFTAAWGANASGVILDFIAGLNGISDAGGNVDAVLSNMGISSQQELKVIKNLAQDSTKLASALDAASGAYRDGTGLSKKYATQTDTTAAKTQEFENALTMLKVSVGEALAPALGTAAEAGTEVVAALSDLAEKCPEVVQGFTAIVTGFAGYVTVVAAIKAIKAAWDAFQLSFTPMAIAAGVTAVVTAIVKEANRISNIGFDDAGKSAEEYAGHVENLRNTVEELQKQYDETADAGGDLTMIDQELTEAKIALAHATEQYNEALDSEAQAASEAAAAEQEQLDYLNSAPGKIATMQAALAELSQAYGDAYAAALESLQGQFGILSQAPEAIITPINEIAEALQSQAKYFQEYAANLQLLKDAGFDGDMLSGLADGSTESVNAVASLAQALSDAASTSPEDAGQLVSDINSLYTAAQVSMEGAAETIASVQTDYDDAWAEIVQTTSDSIASCDQSAQASTNGRNTIQGLISGLTDPALIAQIKAAGTTAAEAFNQAYKDALDINSPSKVMEQMGKYTVQGLTVGIEKETQNAVGAMAALAGSMTAGYATNTPVAGSVVNIYPQSLDESTIDYIYNQMNTRMGVAL